MAKLELKKMALELRQNQQLSYFQIRKLVPVSKSTLSIWLNNFPLSKARMRELRDFSYKRIESYRNTMKLKRESRFNSYLQEQNKIIFPFSERDYLIAGLFLYWGEGSKTTRSVVAVTNSNPAIVKFALIWMIKTLKIDQKKIRARLKLYSDMNSGAEVAYWSNILGLPRVNFAKPYIKASTQGGIFYKGFNHGTCELVVNDTVKKERILADLDLFSSKFLASGV